MANEQRTSGNHQKSDEMSVYEVSGTHVGDIASPWPLVGFFCVSGWSEWLVAEDVFGCDPCLARTRPGEFLQFLA